MMQTRDTDSPTMLRPTPAIDKSFDAAGHVERLRVDGYTIVENFLDAERLSAFRDAVTPLLGRHLGRNPFEGHRTERVYTLVARGRIFEDVATDPRLMTLIGAFLRPGFLLSASHAIDMLPGEVEQSLHTDDSFYPIPRPRPAIGISVIGAIDPFTEENGATIIYPGSHLLADPREVALTSAVAGANGPAAGANGARRLVMPAGAAAVFQGTLLHGAGANRTDAPRLAFTNQYCEPWARTQENFYLAVPRERVRAMAPAVQTLLGYDIMPPFMGQVTASHPLKALEPGWTPPVTLA